MTVVRKANAMAPGEFSPKAALALIFPVVGTIVLAVLNHFLSPSIDPDLKVAIVGAVNSLLALLGAYVGAPGNVVVNE